MAYIDVPIEDYLDELDSDSLIKELKQRGFVVYDDKRNEIKVDNDGRSTLNMDIKRHLCDIVEVGYHTPRSVILEKISTLI